MNRTGRYVLIVGGNVFAVLLFGWGCFRASEDVMFGADFSQRPPADVFQMVFGRPVPDGVTDLRAAGRVYFLKEWVWMRFHATDAALKSLTEGEAPEEVGMLPRENWSANSRYDEVDKRHVGWEAIRSITRPEFYYCGHPPAQGSVQWFGSFVVDRANHTVYVHAGGD
jgi:hypothetical protein